jgi:hypothetical protein
MFPGVLPIGNASLERFQPWSWRSQFKIVDVETMLI